MRQWRGMPRRLVYRIIRTGQVRVNARRAAPDLRLQAGDLLRLPPPRNGAAGEEKTAAKPAAQKIPPANLPVLYEDAHLLAVDKPPGLAVHGGSGLAFGVIERLRAARPAERHLELAHRLDRDTSGVLLLAKKRSALRGLQEQWRRRRVAKEYTAQVFGAWRAAQHRRIRLPLKRVAGADGRRQVLVARDGDDGGKDALTETKLLRKWGGGDLAGALIGARIATGRTHQLRVHLADAGLPIVGDKKYGDFARNKRMPKSAGRMFLHAAALTIAHPASGETLHITAPLPPEFAAVEEFCGGEKAAENPAKKTTQ